MFASLSFLITFFFTTPPSIFTSKNQKPIEKKDPQESSKDINSQTSGQPIPLHQNSPILKEAKKVVLKTPSSAILKVSVGGETGTGFIIESKKGIFLVTKMLLVTSFKTNGKDKKIYPLDLLTEELMPNSNKLSHFSLKSDKKPDKNILFEDQDGNEIQLKFHNSQLMGLSPYDNIALIPLKNYKGPRLKLNSFNISEEDLKNEKILLDISEKGFANHTITSIAQHPVKENKFFAPATRASIRNSAGPLLNKEGKVVGIYMTAQDNNFYFTKSDQLLELINNIPILNRKMLKNPYPIRKDNFVYILNPPTAVRKKLAYLTEQQKLKKFTLKMRLKNVINNKRPSCYLSFNNNRAARGI